MIYAAILAGGVGKRIERTSIPKQFISIGGEPIIALTVREFLKNNRFEKIYIAVHADWKNYLLDLLSSAFLSRLIFTLPIVMFEEASAAACAFSGVACFSSFF